MKAAEYPKIYATVVSRDGTEFQAMTDEGELISLNVSWRTGTGHIQDIQKGLRIKIYQHPDRDHLKFRFVGS